MTDPEIDVEDVDDVDEEPKNSSVRHHCPGSRSVGVRSFKEEDDVEEELLDKEEMVDDEDEPPLGTVKAKAKKSGKKSGKSSGGSGSGSSSSSNPQIKPKCNCDQLRLVDCHLETKELWDKFNELGTEMIITKTGRSVAYSPLFFLTTDRDRQRGQHKKSVHCPQPMLVNRLRNGIKVCKDRVRFRSRPVQSSCQL